MTPQKMSRTWLILFAGICVIAAQGLAATNNLSWSARVWRMDDGLSDNNVSGIVQTSDGYLWVATDSGLARFDGARFQNIAVPIPSGRTRPIIRAILLGRENQIWLALEGGVMVSLSQQGTDMFTKTNGLSGARPTSIAQDQKRGVWTGYSDGSVCRIADGRVTRFAGSNAPAGNGTCILASDIKGQVWFAKAGHVGIIRDGNFQSLLTSGERVIQLGQSRVGGVWVCAGLQLLHCDENGATVNCGTLPVERSGVDPTKVFEDQIGAVWVGTSVNGLFRYDGTNFAQVETSQEEILSLGEDNEGNLWAGTRGGGLDRLRPRVVELQGTESGLPSATVRSICEDSAGVMWAVAQNGDLTRRNDDKWTTITSMDGWSGARATCVVSDGEGGVWIGTDHSGLQRWDNGRFTVLGRGNGLGGETVRGLLLDHAGDLWIALESPSCLQRLHQGRFQTFILPTRGVIRALTEDTAGTLWCGTIDGFLLRVEGDTLKEQTLQSFSSHRDPIRCMNAMPDGSLWIGFAGAGLGIWHNGKFTQIAEAQGLQDAYVCAMMADGDGGFWFTSDHGIFQVRQDELEDVAEGRAEQVHSIPFGRDEGLTSLQGSFGYAPDAVKGRDGRLWFPMRTGLAVVNPLGVPANRAPPPVLVERVMVDGQVAQTNAAGRFVLPPEHRRLEVDFTAPTFVAPENVRFRYRIEGWDDGWLEGGTKRSATYSRLPVGDYTFRVTACNNAGIWDENGTTLTLTVPPFFWQRWPVRAAMLCAFTLGVIATVRYVSYRRLHLKLSRLERETALHRERARIARDLHDDIGASLAHIAMLSELAQNNFEKPLRAKEHLDHIFSTAGTVVRSLDEIVWTMNPKNDTLNHFIAYYLCTYTPDYLRATGIRCRLDLPVDVPATPLPPEVAHHLYLSVKETLHNIVKHAGATEVWLRLRLAAGMITLTIEDNGRGFQTDDRVAPDADGLGNLSRRADEIGGRCEQRSEPGKGTVITFIVPLKNSRI